MKTKLLGLVHGEYTTHTIRVVEIAKALRATGDFDVLFSGDGPEMRFVEEAGFDWVRTKTVKKSHCAQQTPKLIPKIYHVPNFEELFNEEDRLLREQRPDIIIRDTFRELGGIAAKQYGIFDVNVQQANLNPYLKFDFRFATLPKFVEYIPRWFLELTRPPLEMLVKGMASRPLHRKTKQLGLPHEKRSHEGAEADLILMPDSEKLFPGLNPKPKYKYTGPILSFNQNQKPEWQERFLRDKRRKIVITGGTTAEHDRAALYYEAFNNNTAIAFYTNADIDEEHLPNNFYGGDKFNLFPLLEHCDAFIHHGGIGSTYMGLISKIPMVLVHNHFEQNINGVQVKRAGCGIEISHKDVNAKGLREATSQIIEDPNYKLNAERMGDAIDYRGSIQRAVNFIREGYESFKRN